MCDDVRGGQCLMMFEMSECDDVEEESDDVECVIGS